MENAFWIEIEIEPAGTDLRVTARGSRGERPPPHMLGPEVDTARLEAFRRTVGRAVKAGKALDDATRGEAQAIHAALFRGGLHDLAIRLAEAAKDGPVLHRILLRERGLQVVPWEAICEPGTSEGFWGTSPRVHLARGVTSADPCEPREVLGAVRVIAIAPGSDERVLPALRDILAESIAAGEIEWLDPIVGPKAAQRYLFDALRRGKSPHVIHYLGHGGLDAGGHPSLRLADDDDGEESWIKVEALGRELGASFGEDLRLVVLEACEGARSGVLGSAAEILAQAGADAVVAHLWPVNSDVARDCSRALYRSLTGADRAEGDVAASLGAARRTLLLQSAEGFSPVMYLRGTDTSIFDFDGRRVQGHTKARARPDTTKNLERPDAGAAAEAALAEGGMDEHVRTILRRRREVHEKVTTDPRAAAHLARFTAEEIAQYIHLRNIGQARDQLDAILERLSERGLVPAPEAAHFATVQMHGTLWAHPAPGAREPTAHDLVPCLEALDRAVDWYVHEHLGAPADEPPSPEPPEARALAGPPPDMTPPAHATTATGALGTQWLAGALMPVWRGGRPDPHRFQFELPFDQGRVGLALTEERTYYIGRKPLRADGRTANDLVLLGDAVSRNGAAIERSGEHVAIRNTSGRPSLIVSFDLVPPGTARTLAHGDVLAIGGVPGAFLDGRYHATAPASAVDRSSGLLSREGLACDVARALAARKPKALFVAQLQRDEERAACAAADALHAREPAAPVARIGSAAVALVEKGSNMIDRAAAIRRAGIVPAATGWLDLDPGPGAEACARVDAALGAVARIAAAGGNDEPADLARYAVAVVSPADLAGLAAGARAAGFGIGLLVLDDVDRLASLGDTVLAAIELELREMTGSVLRPADRVSHVAPGALAVAAQHDVQRILRDAAASWRARGPIAVGAVELERSLRTFEVDAEDAARMVADGGAFVREMAAGGEAQGLPFPIACWVDAAQRAPSIVERARALVRATEATWHLLACVLAGAFWSAKKRERLAPAAQAAWPAPWRGIAIEAAGRLAGEAGRVGELANAVLDAVRSGAGPLAVAGEQAAALALVAGEGAPDAGSIEALAAALEASLGDALRALHKLRGWSLVSILAIEPLDPAASALRVDFVDHTGPHALGTARRHTVNGMLLGRFVYLVRWAEALAVALEPLVRRARIPGAAADELVLAEAFPAAPGKHAYRAAAGAGRGELDVTERQLAR